jgi:PAS domain S-box-containing protein
MDELQQARMDLERRVEERTTELARLNQSLRDEIVERMGVEAALRDSEAQYRLLFERNPLPAWVFDLDTREILAANETAVWKYGYTRDDLLRMRIDELHPPEDLERPLDYTERFPPETAYMGAWRHRKHDDTVVDVELFAYEVLFRGRWARLVLANDITERKRAEQEVRVLESIARAISEAADLDEALYAVLHHVCQTTGWVLGEAWVPVADGTSFTKSPAWYGSADEFAPFVRQSMGAHFRPAEDMVGRAWTTRQPVWVPDVTVDVNFLRGDGARAVGLRAGMAFPVVAGPEVVAVLTFFLKEERREDEQLIKLVTTVAAHVGLAIQRKRAEERLRESEERFRWLVEGAHDYALYMLDPDGRIASWNRGAQRLKGYAEEEVLGRSYGMFYTEEDVRRLAPRQALDRAVAEGVYESEGWRVRKDGSRFWASATLTALRDQSGTLRGFVKVTRDITERQEAEERLRESEARLARAQEFSLLMVAHTALDGRWLKVPPMLCALLGYTEEELLAGRFRDVTHPDDFDAEWALCQRLIRGEAKSFDIEKRFLRRDGRVIWVYQNTSVVLGSEDRPLHFLTFVRDITERREAEEQLKKSELQLSEAQRLAHLGSWEWNIAAGNVEWSDELYRIYGVKPGTPVTFDAYLGYVHPEERERVKQVVAQAIRNHEPFTMEERIVRADGEVRHLLSQGALIVNAKGEVGRMVGVCLDITERKRAEERVREYASRLQGLSLRLLEAQETERRRIARELHDQIGQDLSVIKINLQTLKRLPGSGTLGSYIDETIRVVEGVLATARNLSLELRPSMLDDLGLAAALRWYLDRQAQRAGFALHFEAETAEKRVPPAIETACFRLAQEAVTNIMRHGHAARVDVQLDLDEHALRMRITDDGEGFDVEAARQRASRGESFGLLGMEERALLAGGRLEIISAPGQGTEVHVHFPLSGDNE